MINRVTLKYFKKFSDETFYLSERVVLAGPNNSGKSTLLQSISVWNLGLQRWNTWRRKPSSKAVERTGVPLSRKDFTAIPLREMNLLWTDRDTAFSKDEKAGVKAGIPKPAEIVLYGKEDGVEWNLSVHLRYANRELIYVRVTDAEGQPYKDTAQLASALQIVHVPPFSGIGAEETRYDKGYQNLLIGQGKPGDILRNLLWEVYQKDESKRREWGLLAKDINEIFGYELQEPRYTETDPYIQIEYIPQKSKGRKPLDLATAGSGFHQVLTLLAFFYARPASVLLVDEPDAHEHVILQRQVYDRLRTVAGERRCQLIISTHSEVILEETSPEQILSFYGKPHRIQLQTGRDRVREALKMLSSFDILQAEERLNVLYLEDETDLKILRELARVLKHPMVRFLNSPFFFPIHGRDVRVARDHFFSLQAIHDSIRGVLLLDGDNRSLTEHEVSAEGLTILRWQRYEIENYLLFPEALYRFIKGPELTLFTAESQKNGESFLKSQLPPAAFMDPLADSEFLVSVAASKSLLPGFFKEAGVEVSKKDIFQVAAQMKPNELSPEVKEKLDVMAKILLADEKLDA